MGGSGAGVATQRIGKFRVLLSQAFNFGPLDFSSSLFLAKANRRFSISLGRKNECRSVVEPTTHVQEVMGSNPAGCWAFYSSLPVPFIIPDVMCDLQSAKGHSFC